VIDTPSTPRSVKIGADERTGWSSERPRKEGSTPRLPDISTRNRVLSPAFRLRYSPGSLLVVVGPASANPARWVDRVVEERPATLSLAKVRQLLKARVPDDQIEPRAADLLHAAVVKRMEAKQSVALALEGFDRAEREHYVRIAHAQRRPRHIILIEGPRDQVTEEERGPLDELRKQLDDAELGAEGFQTSLRLGGSALQELKRIVFQPPPPED
jgi:predicted kinase